MTRAPLQFTARAQWRTILGMAALLTLAPASLAQNSPHIGYVYPAGGRPGATFQVVVGGQFLGGVTNVFFSGPGMSGTVTEYKRPLTQREFNDLREKLRELQEKRQNTNRRANPSNPPAETQAATNAPPEVRWTPEDEKLLAEVRKKLANPPNRQANPAIAETALLQITMASDTSPGEREVRLGTPSGLSNPLAFWVGQLPEIIEREPTNTPAQRGNNPARFQGMARPAPEATELRVTIPATINGQIMPGDVDRYRFNARRGQRLVIAASARQLIPYLPDAVPGWFQATLALSDAKGRELAYDDDFRFNPDPVLYFEIPKDGEYVVEIKDSVYRGREDFVYRLSIGELPFVTSVFPMGGPAGVITTVQLQGWNLPVTSLTIDFPEPGLYPLSVTKNQWTSNPVPFAVDTLPESFESEPNHSPTNAQPITLPGIVNGRIDPPGDVDVFRFEGRVGDRVIAETQARRLNSPLDSVLKLTDAAGRPVAFNDDYEDKGAGLTTHHADSYLAVDLPADGTYYLQLSDAQHKGGIEYAYRLRVSPPRPDFALRIVPSSINARPGSTVPVTVYALRRDGFSNSIAIKLREAPAGFSLGGARVPMNQDKVRITLAFPANPPGETLTLNFEGQATIQGREIVRPALPAEDMMQAFAYRHLVPARELRVALSGRAMARANLRMLGETPVKIPLGGAARIQFASGARAFAPQLQLELSDPPDGISLQNVTPSFGGTEIVLQCDAAKVKSGQNGNLIVNAFAAGAGGARGSVRPQGNQRRAPVGTLPAIPFEIVPP